MKNLSSVSRFVCLTMAVIACSTEQSSQQTPAAVTQAPESTSTPASQTPASPTPEPNPDWVVSETGIGTIKAGMTLQEAKQILPDLKSSEDLAKSGCTYARSASLPSGVVLMFQHGRIARVDILTGSARTSEGGGIGDTEARLQSLYGARLKTSPHKYTDGHYMTLTSPTDTTYKIVFETDGAKVLRFRSGKTPPVEFVEGCG